MKFVLTNDLTEPALLEMSGKATDQHLSNPEGESPLHRRGFKASPAGPLLS